MSLRANTLANLGSQLLTAVLVLALAPAYIDQLGLEAWGLIGILAVLSAWFNLLDVGLTPAITREVAGSHGGGPAAARRAGELVRCVELIYLGLMLGIVILVGISAGYIATRWLQLTTLQVTQASAAIALMGLVVALRLYENIYRSILIGFEELLTLNALSSVFAVLRWGGGLIFIAVEDPGTVVVLFAWQAGVAAISLLVF
ncbi:MAG: polysaccharide biosynthesis protein, partial [Planctomycetota bacterium]